MAFPWSARLCAVLACALPLWATAASADPAAKTEPKVKAEKKQKPPTVKLSVPGGSGETVAERRARLQRECKGRPNAGACTGHTD